MNSFVYVFFQCEGHVTLGTGRLLTRHNIGSTRWQGIEGLCLVNFARDCAMTAHMETLQFSRVRMLDCVQHSGIVLRE